MSPFHLPCRFWRVWRRSFLREVQVLPIGLFISNSMESIYLAHCSSFFRLQSQLKQVKSCNMSVFDKNDSSLYFTKALCRSLYWLTSVPYSVECYLHFHLLLLLCAHCLMSRQDFILYLWLALSNSNAKSVLFFMNSCLIGFALFIVVPPFCFKLFLFDAY